jgi:uncharacterized protein (TIGR02246 family)
VLLFKWEFYMIRPSFAVVFVMNGLFVASSYAADAAAQSADETAIRKSAAVFVEAYDRGSAEDVAALWTEDGDYTVGGTTVKGRPAIAKLYGDFFRANPGSKMNVKIDSIRMLAPTVAIEEGTASVSNSPNGPSSSSAYTAVHVKQGDQWRMASVREAEVPTIQIDEGLKELEWLIGTWTAQGDANKVEVRFDWIAAQHFLHGETTVHAKDAATSGGMQVIGRDPLTGQIVSWFFGVDGGHGYGAWLRDGNRWMIDTEGAAGDGTRTSATNVLYRADDNVMSWQSVNRNLDGMHLPDEKEIVFERAPASK